MIILSMYLVLGVLITAYGFHFMNSSFETDNKAEEIQDAVRKGYINAEAARCIYVVSNKIKPDIYILSIQCICAWPLLIAQVVTLAIQDKKKRDARKSKSLEELINLLKKVESGEIEVKTEVRNGVTLFEHEEIENLSLNCLVTHEENKFNKKSMKTIKSSGFKVISKPKEIEYAEIAIEVKNIGLIVVVCNGL